MRRHDFGYFFHEGVVNLFSHGFMSFAAVGITVACLLVMGTFSLVAYNVNEQLRQLESENEILAFVDDTLAEAQGRSLQSAVEAVPNVRSVRFITREEACETFEKKYEGKYALGDLDPEILRDRFAIKVIDLGRMEETREAVKKVTGIAGRPRGRKSGGRLHHAAERGGRGVHRAHRDIIGRFRVHHFQYHQAHDLRPARRDRHYEDGRRDERLHPLALCV